MRRAAQSHRGYPHRATVSTIKSRPHSGALSQISANNGGRQVLILPSNVQIVGFILFLFRRGVATAGALHGGPLTRCDTWKAILVLGGASRRCARRYEACNFSLRRHPAPYLLVPLVCLGLQSTGCQMAPTAPMPKTCLRREHIRSQLAPVHRSRRACSHRCAAVAPSLSMASILSRLPPMAWMDGGSRSRCSWAPELLLATADKQIRADKGRRAAGTRRKKTSPRKSGAANPPLLVRAG